jgi:hypothetical protein
MFEHGSLGQHRPEPGDPMLLKYVEIIRSHLVDDDDDEQAWRTALAADRHDD